MEALREEFLAGAHREGVDDKTAVTRLRENRRLRRVRLPQESRGGDDRDGLQVRLVEALLPRGVLHGAAQRAADGLYSPEVICNDARRHDLDILPVDVNHSRAECTLESDSTRRLGYRYVQGLGVVTLKRVDAEADNDPYCS